MTDDLVNRIVETAGGAVLRLGQLLARDQAIVATAHRLGWQLDNVPPPITALGVALRTIEPALDAIAADPESPTAWPSLLEAVASGANAIAALGTVDFGAALNGLGFAGEFPTQLLHWAVIEHLSRTQPGLLGVLRAAGIVVAKQVDPGAGRVPYRDERFVVPDFSAVLASPSNLLRAAWAWGEPSFDATAFLQEIGNAFRRFGVTSGFQLVPASTPESSGQDVGSGRWHLINRLLVGGNAAGEYELGLRWLVFDQAGLPALAIIPYVEGTLDAAVVFGDLQISFTGMATGGDQIALVISPTSIDLVSDFRAGGATAPNAALAIAFGPSGTVAPTTRTIGDVAALTTKGWTLQLAATASSSGSDVALELGLPGASLGIATGGSGLLGSAGLGDQATIPMPLTVGVSYRRGVYLGAGGLSSIPLPPISIGPVQLRDGAVALAGVTQGFAATLTTNVVVDLGPVTITLFGLGAALVARFPGAGGNLGPLDVGADAFAPTGGAVSVTTSILTGGGAIDHVAGRDYRGALAFDLLGVQLSALGILDDSPEHHGSFVAVVSAQFRPIQLGLGFTLNGVGGLVGIKRRVDGDALRAALRGAGISDIFFPSDPIAQAARLLGDLATYFPAANGRYVFGPAVKLGWATPTIVEAELAILLEMPSPIRLFLLGTARIKLPTKDKALIQLEIDVVGELDITEKRLAIDATLRDSRVLTFPIIGDFALRTSWGSQKTLVLSVGGFHSQFRPPPDFPTLRRVRIPIGADDDPRLDITGFLAVTSNTAQIGASIELYASAGPLNIQGNVGFEALFQFSPFAFRVDLSAGVALRRGTTTLASVHLDATLTGTTPWHITGEASLSCWLFDLSVPFTASFGKGVPVVLPPTAIWPLVQPALEDPASWAAELPLAAARAVTTAPPVDATAAEAAAAHIEPTAALTVRQKIVPLDRTVTRFADGAPSDVTQLIVTGATIGTGGASYTPVTDWFAPAQFEDLSDADRLPRDGFELMDAGISLGSDAMLAGSELVVPLEYETVTIAPTTTPPPSRYRPTLLAQLLAGQLGTVERGTQLVTPGGLPEEVFVVASSENLIVAPGPRGMAELALLAHLSAHPEDVGNVIVVPTHEIVA